MWVRCQPQIKFYVFFSIVPQGKNKRKKTEKQLNPAKNPMQDGKDMTEVERGWREGAFTNCIGIFLLGFQMTAGGALLLRTAV